MASSSSKAKCADFEGKGNVNVFLTKVGLIAAIKGHADEKKAQFLASKLSGPAFDGYMRLSGDDKKDFGIIKEQLKKEFGRGQLNKEEAIHVLNGRQRKQEESPQTFAYKIRDLMNLAYPTSNDAAQKTLYKGYFMHGIHPDVQVALKAETTLDALATETVRLELAGIKSYGTKCARLNETSSVNEVVESIANKVLEKLNLNAVNLVHGPDRVGSGAEPPSDSAAGDGIYYISSNPYSPGGQNNFRSARGRWNNRGRGRARGQNQNQRGGGRKCRGCGRGEAILSEPVRNDTVRRVETRAMISITKFVRTTIID